MSLQKIVNVLAVASATVSVAVVGTVGYVYVNRTAILENVKEQVMDGVLGGLGGGLGGSTGLAPELPVGSNDLSPTTNPELDPQASADVPSL